jgi:aryl-phospho-beta-D-glucosidase BglC (GH1 family)
MRPYLLALLAACVQAGANPFWKSFKARGVNLGNWLILEEWMDPGYYQRTAPGAVADEWSFCSTLGKEACEAQLQAHWTSFITDSDIQDIANAGFNLLRIPIGHWALVPTTADEPYIFSTQMEHVTRILEQASNNHLYAVLDLHALPGSQNGKDHSGRQGGIEWYTKANQQRSLTVVQAAMRYIQASPYRHTIAAIELCNEPNITTKDRRKTYEAYLKSAKQIVQKTNASMPIMFHDGFQGVSSWSDFGKNPKDNYVLDVHEYYTGALSNSERALQQACAAATANPKFPVFFGEYSLSVGGAYQDTDAWRSSFFQSQQKLWEKQAGGAFWSWKVAGNDGKPNNGWSVRSLLSQNLIDWSFADAKACPKTS